MKRILKIILPAVLVAAMLVTVMPGTALAQDDQTPERRGALVAKVAEILNIDRQELEDAFKQAQRELREENPEARLKELVASGTLTQQQADGLKAWMESRPADIPKASPRQLKKLLDEDKLTQAQADAYKAWLEAKPEMPKIRPELRQKGAAKLQEHRDALTARVAEILNIDKQKLEDAFKQAQSELREKALDTRLQELVNQGAWTQQQADAFKAWIKARPDVPRIGPMGSMGPRGPMGPQQ